MSNVGGRPWPPVQSPSKGRKKKVKDGKSGRLQSTDLHWKFDETYSDFQFSKENKLTDSKAFGYSKLKT